jgi:hypothetical protein
MRRVGIRPTGTAEGDSSGHSRADGSADDPAASLLVSRVAVGKGSAVSKSPTGDREAGHAAVLRRRRGARDATAIGDSHRHDVPVRVFPTATHAEAAALPNQQRRV